MRREKKHACLEQKTASFPKSDRESVSGSVQTEFQAASDWSSLGVLLFFFFSVSKRFVVESDRRVKRWGEGFVCLISGAASMSSH